MAKNRPQPTPPSKPSPRVSTGNNGKSTKAPAKSKKKKVQRDSTGDESPDEDSDDEDELDDDGNVGTGKKGGKKLVWNEKLTWALIARINEDAKIKRGLYPPPGPNPSTANGGGKPKSDFHAELAQALFEGHEKYGAQFAEASKSGKLSKWAGKIKNRLNTLEKKTRHYFDLMGETGQGITREEEIDITMNSELMNKWRSIKTAFPYYLDMRDLIGQRPNIIHAGVGNGRTEVDVDAIIGHRDSDQPLTIVDDVRSEPPSPGSILPSVPPLSFSPPASPSSRDEARLSHKRSGSFRELSDTDDEEATELLASIQAQNPADDPPNKTARNATPDTPNDTPSKSGKSLLGPTKKTPALPRTSTPVSKGKAKNSSKKLKFANQFTEATIAEEHTRQKELDVRISRAELEKLKIEGKIAAKREKIRLKGEMQKLAMIQEHQERTAKITQRQWADGRDGQNSQTRAYRPDQPALEGTGPSSSKSHQQHSDPLAPPYTWVGDQENFWDGVPVAHRAPLGDPLADPLVIGADMNLGVGDGTYSVGEQDGGW